MGFQVGIQLILVVISVALVMSFVKPKLEEIEAKQVEINTFTEAINRASDYNQVVKEKVNRVNNFPRADQVSLDRFLPETIDGVAVSRDIENIIKSNQMLLVDMEMGLVSPVLVSTGRSADDEVASLAEEAQRNVVSQRFQVSVIGTYENMKKMLGDFERNAYPLRLVNLSFSASPNSNLNSFSFELEAIAIGNVD